MKNSKDRTSVRQNAAYTASRKHAANLRRNPTLHFQVGLIIALLVTIFFMEVKMPETSYTTPAREYDHEEAVWDEQFQVEKKSIEVAVPKIKPAPAKPQLPDEVVSVDKDTHIIETIVKGTSEVDSDTPLVDPNAVAYEEEEEDDAPIPLNFVETVPLFPGCEGLETNDERKACMSSKINKLINKKFNTSLSEKLGLKGVNRIFVQFTVDKAGNVTNIESRAPHDRLKKEAQRVVNLLPKMKPGKQGSLPVGVIYSLPITFKVED